ncbi:MFS general substrate transporter [Gonapodya prolifera JEL478]|uniref:MFS general substrate transporter n=1 Tax=Gonapodya prolifera (strain JEL478) TaxID=1344416 RepID=A0A139AVP0_GONPJ|nr:MFS general substrate transporter [Gonapodya prolifera JEL478]|eukprot:KXS20802.1 MFS general substrate transporter [Gonapodya prolifera JEL478]
MVEAEKKVFLATDNLAPAEDDAYENQLSLVDPDTPGWEPSLVWTEEEEKQLVRKFDFTVMPVIIFLFIFLNLDRFNISNALTNNFTATIHATLDTINLGSTMLLVGFCVFEIPSNMVIQKVGAHRWLPFLMIGWGLVSTFQMFISEPNGFLATRFLIGAFEAGWIPGVVLYLSFYYKRGELATRLAYFWACNNLASSFSGLLAFGILRMDGIAGLHGWQWLFGLEGAATVLAGISAFWLLQEVPQYNLRLSERERKLAVTRIIKDDPTKAIKEKQFVPLRDVWAAISDWNVWPNLIFAFINQFVTAGFSLYSPLIIQSFGFDALLSNVLTIPGQVFHLFNQLIQGYVADRYKTKWTIIVFGMTGLLLGYVLNLAIPASKSQAGAYFSLIWTVGFFLPWHAVNASWQAANVAPNGKRAIIFSMYIISVNISSAFGVWIYRDDDKPGFRRALGTSIGLLAVAITIVILRRIQLGFLNRLRERKWSKLDEKEKARYLKEDAPKLGDRALSFRYIW